MKTLVGKSVFLRALEPSDLSFLYALENDEDVWQVSHTIAPYSKFVLEEYLNNAHRDIYDVKQLRLVICISETEQAVGFIDLFDFEPKHGRVGVGIIIFKPEDRGKGYAKESLTLVIKYAKQHLQVHQVYANISEENKSSIRLFEKIGFLEVGLKKDWNRIGNEFRNEILYQLVFNE